MREGRSQRKPLSPKMRETADSYQESQPPRAETTAGTNVVEKSNPTPKHKHFK